jgi:Tfp pilus assembly protein PilF
MFRSVLIVLMNELSGGPRGGPATRKSKWSNRLVRSRRSSYPGPEKLVPTDALAKQAVLREAVHKQPKDVAAWIALSQACQVLIDEQGAIDAARAAVDLAPDNVDAIRQYAYSLVQVGRMMADARVWFDRLHEVAPEDPIGLYYRYNFALLSGDYWKAIDACERLDRLQPDNPFTPARIARARRLLGDSAGAAEHFARAAARCSTEQDPFPFGRWASLKPVYSALAGDPAAAERMSVDLCQVEGDGLADLSNPRYPDDCEASIARLQSRIRGRDLFVFGNGPSLKEIVLRKEEVASLDFASMTMSTFQLVNDDLLRPTGKQLDMVCMSHPSMVKSQTPAILEWFSAVPEATLVLPLWMRDLAAAKGEPDFLLGRSDAIFWYDCYGEHLPNPQEPLHVPSLNNLLFALFAGVLGLPRRIFMFGFDGQIKGTDSQQPDTLYYKELHESYHADRRREPDVRELTRTTLLWDSWLFNELAPGVLRHASLLFDLPQPPIYNVCPDSAVTVFPRITFDRFRQLVSE